MTKFQPDSQSPEPAEAQSRKPQSNRADVSQIADGWLNLEQQKKRAKELLKALRSHDEAAWIRLRTHHPRSQRFESPDNVTLSAAQLVIAREQGLSSWPALRAHIHRLVQVKRAIAQGQPDVPDADLSTVHIRCGSDIRQALETAGFAGDFLEFADPYCQGPVPQGLDLRGFIAIRAQFIATAYGLSLADIQQRLEREYQRLDEIHVYDRAVLWFEHDAYDQLILAHILSNLQWASRRPRQIELICPRVIPGVRRFVGLGQLAVESLRSLWDLRQPITPAMLDLGDRTWQALTTDSPLALARIAEAGTSAIPPLAGAIRRHLQELPWSDTGLSLTQRLTLDLVAESEAQGEAPTAAQVFRRLTAERDPLPYLGDTMYWHELDRILTGDRPPLTVEPETIQMVWGDRRLRLTSTGKALLAGEQNGLELGLGDRWVGGIRIPPGNPGWVWDTETNYPRRI